MNRQEYIVATFIGIVLLIASIVGAVIMTSNSTSKDVRVNCYDREYNVIENISCIEKVHLLYGDEQAYMIGYFITAVLAIVGVVSAMFGINGVTNN